MKRALVLGYGLFAYLGFLAVFLLLADFIANIGFVRGIDEPPTAAWSTALVIDLALVALFGASHSVLARPAIKARWTRIVPDVLVRSTYVLVTNAALALIVWQWRAIPAQVWNVETAPARIAIWTLCGAGVALVVVASFLTDHFDLFGLRQVWLYARRRLYAPVAFKVHGVYRWIRHPMMAGILLWIWATPSMSVGHLVFATSMTLYIFIGVSLEDRDMARAFGERYAAYRHHVGAFLPIRRWNG